MCFITIVGGYYQISVCAVLFALPLVNVSVVNQNYYITVYCISTISRYDDYFVFCKSSIDIFIVNNVNE